MVFFAIITELNVVLLLLNLRKIIIQWFYVVFLWFVRNRVFAAHSDPPSPISPYIFSTRCCIPFDMSNQIVKVWNTKDHQTCIQMYHLLSEKLEQMEI